MISLHRIGLGQDPIENLSATVVEVRIILGEWSKLVGNDGIVKILEPLISQIVNEREENKVRSLTRILDFLISPFEHYMISLEEFKRDVPRDATTRCGMVIERVTGQLWYELKRSEPPKVEDRIGGIQDALTKRLGIKGIEDFCSLMKSVYHIRDWKGPHDVPAADSLDAKFCITSISKIYSIYLEILKLLGYNLGDSAARMSEFVNSIVLLSPMLAVGKKGKLPEIDDVILNIYQNGFFKTKRTFNEICEKIEERYSFPKPTIFRCLDRFYSKKKILNREGKRGAYTFIQRVSPEEFYR